MLPRYFLILLFQVSLLYSLNRETPLFTYDFGGLEEKPIAKQLEILQDIGFDGITIFEDDTNTLAFLDEWYTLLDQNPDFEISAFYYRHRYSGSWHPRTYWKPIMDKLAERGIPFLVIIKEEKGFRDIINYEDALLEFQKLNNYGKKIGVPVVIYPHSFTFIESVEEALPYVQEINDPNFTLSFHLCHELRFGNEDKIDALLEEITPHLSVVTLNGAHSSNVDTIVPLTEGDYDVQSVVEKLVDLEYDGPLGLHTHKIPGPPKEHLTGSFSLLNSWIESFQPVELQDMNTNVSNEEFIFTQTGQNLRISWNSTSVSSASLRIFNARGQILYETEDFVRSERGNFFNLNSNEFDWGQGVLFYQIRANNRVSSNLFTPTMK